MTRTPPRSLAPPSTPPFSCSATSSTDAALEEIGREAGITPAFIARAAAAADRTASPPTTYLGMPVSAARSVNLPGPFSDEDWDRLVVDLRETFQARGTVRREGSLRTWRNGNLHALIEPTASGHRLRLRTRNGNAQSTVLGGLGALAIGLAFLLILAVAGDLALDKDTLVLALFAAIGMGTVGMAAYRLPRWAEERGRQMDAVAARAVERMVVGRTAVERRAVRPDASLPELEERSRFDLGTPSALARTKRDRVQ